MREERFLLWSAERQIQDMLQNQGMLNQKTEVCFRKQFKKIEKNLNRLLGNGKRHMRYQLRHGQQMQHNHDMNRISPYNDNQAVPIISLPAITPHMHQQKVSTILHQNIFYAVSLVILESFPKKDKSSFYFLSSIPKALQLSSCNTSCKKQNPLLHFETVQLFRKKSAETLVYNVRCSFSPSISVVDHTLAPEEGK